MRFVGQTNRFVGESFTNKPLPEKKRPFLGLLGLSVYVCVCVCVCKRLLVFWETKAPPTDIPTNPPTSRKFPPFCPFNACQVKPHALDITSSLSLGENAVKTCNLSPFLSPFIPMRIWVNSFKKRDK